MKPKVYIDGQEGTTGLQIYDRLARRTDIELLRIEEGKRKDAAARKKRMDAADLVFLCLPDDAAREAVTMIDFDHTRVIDASTAHRVAPGWVYGLPEVHGQRAQIKTAPRVANPGCYATGCITLLRPLIEGGILPADYPLAIHGLSGYTGAGKKAIAQYEDPQRDGELDSPRHYATTLAHKHLPEITALCGLAHPPILMPMICDYPQGMVITVPLYLNLLRGVSDLDGLRKVYGDYYAGEPLVELRPADAPTCGFLGANNLAGSNGIQLFVCGNGEQAMLVSRFDNLGKGASGAAVQNMNLMLGFDETTGLTVE